MSITDLIILVPLVGLEYKIKKRMVKMNKIIKNNIKKFESNHKGLKIINLKEISKNSYRGNINICTDRTIKINMSGVFMQGQSLI